MTQEPQQARQHEQPPAKRLRHLIHEGFRFMVVGGFGYVTDVAVFNLLLYAGDPGVLHHKPLTAKVIAVVVATLVTFTGHRLWTYGHRERGRTSYQYVLFFFFNGVGLGIALVPLAISRYLLGLDGPLADNISANVVGLALGTAFRWWAYRTWVFPPTRRSSAPHG
ncbi:MAG TPA: GtrA family protein [Jiangellaceae bacterium]|nr:GtrA family protein [Jiangellaceae bacterium]